jgi:hypothetical protein
MKQRAATSSAPELSNELEGLAQRAAVTWIEQWRVELTADGRPMRGGWPGTLSEARSRVTQRLREEWVDASLDGATVESVARRAYDAARLLWRAQSERDEDDE